MANANRKTTAEFISDYVAGRLDGEDLQVMEEAIKQDEVIAAAVTAARRVHSRTTTALATSRLDASRPRL